MIFYMRGGGVKSVDQINAWLASEKWYFVPKNCSDILLENIILKIGNLLEQ